MPTLPNGPGCEAMLAGREVVPAVEFVCDSSTTDGEHATTPVENDDRLASLDSIQKDDLGAWIERLRDAGIHADRRGSPDLLSQLIQTIKRPVDTVLCSLLDWDPMSNEEFGTALVRQPSVQRNHPLFEVLHFSRKRRIIAQDLAEHLQLVIRRRPAYSGPQPGRHPVVAAAALPPA